MGEKLKTLAKGTIKGNPIEIELNKPSKKGGLHHIHLQNDTFRADFDEVEFMKLATGILAAKRKLLALKGELK